LGGAVIHQLILVGLAVCRIFDTLGG
jgi:hypothetical protein